MGFLNSAVPAYVAIAVFVPLFIAIVVLLGRTNTLRLDLEFLTNCYRTHNGLSGDRMTKIERKLTKLEGRLDTEIELSDDAFTDVFVALDKVASRSIGNRLYEAWQSIFSS